MIEDLLFKFNNKRKGGHQKTQFPIMLCFKAEGIHTAPPGNPYKNNKIK